MSGDDGVAGVALVGVVPAAGGEDELLLEDGEAVAGLGAEGLGAEVAPG